MDLDLRRPNGRAIPIGAAGGWVHPATGYSFGFSATAAQAMKRAVEAGATDPHQVWSAVWSQSAVAVDQLYRFGGGILAGLSADEQRRFFAAFFACAPDDVAAFMSRRATANQIRKMMWKVYRKSGWRIRHELRRGLVRNPKPVFRSLVRENVSLRS